MGKRELSLTRERDRFRLIPLVQVIVDMTFKLRQLLAKEVTRTFDDPIIDADIFLQVQLGDQLVDGWLRHDLIFIAWIIKPDDGQGAKKLKSKILAGGAAQMNVSISGRRINNCIAR